MSKVQVELDMNEVLHGLSELQGDEFEAFAGKVLSLQAQRKAPSLTKNETALLQKINVRLSVDDEVRLEHLNKKLHDETLTKNEHEELMGLLGHVEQLDVERMSALIELAALRGVSLEDMMKQLGFLPQFRSQIFASRPIPKHSQSLAKV
jgi:hypothetical protein